MSASKLDPFYEHVALAFASATYSDWLRQNPNASPNEKMDSFFACIEGGMTVAIEFLHRCEG